MLAQPDRPGGRRRPALAHAAHRAGGYARISAAQGTLVPLTKPNSADPTRRRRAPAFNQTLRPDRPCLRTRDGHGVMRVRRTCAATLQKRQPADGTG